MTDYKSQNGKMDMESLKLHNKLKYQLPSNLNVVERRTNKVSFSDQNTYTSGGGAEIVIRMTASTDYVYGPNCYLTFDVQVASTAGSDFVFNNSTAMNLFSRVLYEDKSGSELERNTKLNSYCAQVLPWHWSGEYSKVGAANAGQFQADIQDAASTGYVLNGVKENYDMKTSKVSVCIPLRWFCGIFNQETLIPSMLISGSLLRLQLESANRALESTTATLGTGVVYTLSNPRVILDSMSLSPIIQKNLLEQSQSAGGLDFTYETAYYQSGNPATSTNFNLQVNKAVSRASRIYWSAHAQTTAEATNKQNFGTGPCNVTQLDTRIGDMYLPQRVITVTDATSILGIAKRGGELYQNSLQSVQRAKTNIDPPSITKNMFLTTGTPLNQTDAVNNNNGRCVHVQSLEQSSCLQYSGLAINNSRTLEVRVNFFTPAEAQVMDLWLCYVKLAKCNQLRAIIKE